MNPIRHVAQAAIAAAVMAGIGYFSKAPAYDYFPSDHALIKLSLSHAGQRIEPCRERTAEELAALRPNMRKKMECARERIPVYVELDLDGAPVFKGASKPSGLSKDGSSQFYEKVAMPAGVHRLAVRMRDSTRTDGGFDFSFEGDVTLAPLQSLVVGFRGESGEFFLR